MIIFRISALLSYVVQMLIEICGRTTYKCCCHCECVCYGQMLLGVDRCDVEGQLMSVVVTE